MNAEEQHLADLLKGVVPEPPRQLTYEEITVRHAERTVKSWLMPTLAAASVLAIAGAAGAVAATRSGQAAPGAPAAYQGTTRTGGPATPVPLPTSPGCQPAPEPSPAGARSASVTVPGVIGQPVAQAEGTLSQAGLDVVVTERASQTVPAGTTLLQSPAMGTRVPRGTTVKLTISSGSAAAKPAAAPVPMPTCVAQAPGIAAPSAVPTAAPGTAVASPLPSVPGGGPSAVPTAAPGTAVPSPVATSGGPAAVPTVGEVSMPSLIGKTSLTAVHTAQVEGLTVVLKDKPAPATQSVPGGVVWGQAPAGGSGVPAGATVTLYCQP